MRRPWRRFACAAVLLAAVGVLLFAGKTLDAGVVGSPHDFSGKPFASSGACSACHIPHGADSYALWARDLGLYRTKLTMDGGASSEPNYVHAPTIQCYDCHDSHDDTSNRIDAVPAKNDFSAGHYPQNIAFGFTKTGLGSMTEDGPGGSVPGYYENKPPDSASNYGADPNLNPADNTQLVKTGGHYFKYVDPDGGTTTFKKGDKLPCRDCHDPHAWDSLWQAFFRKSWPTEAISSRLGSTAAASSYMANNAGTRDTLYGGRKLCTACHGTSDGTSVLFSDISSQYFSSAGNIVKPPSTVDEHSSSNTSSPCVSCHQHNSVSAGCNSCHSYPGQDNSVSGKQMSRGHWPHVGQPGEGGTANSMAYACEVCHSGYKTQHNQSGYAAGAPWTPPDYYANVNVRFDNTLNPGAPTYGGLNAGTSTAPGNGGTGTCAGLYCHGDNPEKNLRWEGAAKQPAWNGTVACGACHKADSTFRQGNHAVHLDNTGANARGPGGIAVFSPALSCADGTATGCHTAYGKTPETTHTRGTTTFRTSPDSGLATDNNGTLVCNNCHSTQNVGYLDNGSANTTTAGVAFAKGNWVDNTYRLPCLTCHNNSGQTPGSTANARMDGAAPPTGAWAPGIEKYWRTSGHGYSLVVCPTTTGNIDNCSTTDTTTPNVYQRFPVPCGSCHDTNSRHFGNTTGTGNAWRLGSWSNYNVASGGLDKFCALQCHGGSDAGSPWTCALPGLPMDHFWIDGNDVVCPRDPNKEGTDTHPTLRDVVVTGKTKDPHEMGANYMPIESDIRSGGGVLFLCVTCHDPHGTGGGDANHWGRSFAGANATSPVDNVHMLRYELRSDLCRKCHL